MQGETGTTIHISFLHIHTHFVSAFFKFILLWRLLALPPLRPLSRRRRHDYHRRTNCIKYDYLKLSQFYGQLRDFSANAANRRALLLVER